ncbi:TetR/AcrR family transcriptional regulator [Roseomonas sp. 18066]|uniref:TetR/AcrR family transcriptional regulator n=1 Tax=Roseomonas sp. 18066 TaxID=2681412 RepID=UPI00135935A1|nr:TetR/AcrR family transcriptional regulator [Roseomonas sp. 18066]
MTTREMIRCGGRSARIQSAVHAAVAALLREGDRAGLTLPMVAARAGVTPSTLYRRWGDLPALLADVALQRMRPQEPPLDTGALRGDLRAWAEQYREEMGSEPGQAMIRDVLLAPGGQQAQPCAALVAAQLAVIDARARGRGEAGFDVAAAMDLLVAPIVYRLLFAEAPLPAGRLESLLDRLLGPG